MRRVRVLFLIVPWWALALTGCCEEAQTPNPDEGAQTSGAEAGANNTGKAAEPGKATPDGQGEAGGADGAGEEPKAEADAKPVDDEAAKAQAEADRVAREEKRKAYEGRLGIDSQAGWVSQVEPTGQGFDMLISAKDETSGGDPGFKGALMTDDEVFVEIDSPKQLVGNSAEYNKHFARCQHWSGIEILPLSVESESPLKISMWCNKTPGGERPTMAQLVTIVRASSQREDGKVDTIDPLWVGLGSTSTPDGKGCVVNLTANFTILPPRTLERRTSGMGEWVGENPSGAPMADPEKEPARAKCLAPIEMAIDTFELPGGATTPPSKNDAGAQPPGGVPQPDVVPNADGTE